jgi:hypothetical protein
MKVLTAAVVSAMFLFSHVAQAQESSSKRQVPKVSSAHPYTAEESAALSKGAREKAEALELARDRRMRAISKGICTGC